MEKNVKTSDIIIYFISDVNYRLRINVLTDYFIFNFRNLDHNGSWTTGINYLDDNSYKYVIKINKDKKWVKR